MREEKTLRSLYSSDSNVNVYDPERIKDELIQAVKDELVVAHMLGRIAGRHEHHFEEMLRYLGVGPMAMDMAITCTAIEYVFDRLGEIVDGRPDR